MPILRGAKIVSFLLAAVTLGLISTIYLARPTQAEFLPLLKCAPDVVCDTTTPTITDLALSRTIAGGTQNEVLVTATAEGENLSEYQVTVTRSNDGGEPGVVVSTTALLSENSATISYGFNATPALNFTSGTYVVTLTVRSEAGTETSESASLVVDNDGPVTTITGGDVILKDGSITPAVTTDDPEAEVLYAWSSDAQNPDGLSLSYTVKEPTFTPKSKGTYNYFLTTTDALGNVTKDTLFTFGYAPQLETLPLPIVPTGSLTDKLVTDTPTSPQATTSIPAQIDAARDVANPRETSTVLGSTLAAPGQLPPTTGGSLIAPTSSGWSIFGMLWYWWAIIAAIIATALYYAKKVSTTAIPNKT